MRNFLSDSSDPLMMWNNARLLAQMMMARLLGYDSPPRLHWLINDRRFCRRSPKLLVSLVDQEKAGAVTLPSRYLFVGDDAGDVESGSGACRLKINRVNITGDIGSQFVGYPTDGFHIDFFYNFAADLIGSKSE